ncbi:hypothetical protein [Deinococcus sp. Leaf326]|uniref:hypothetical protein n=1 Tax=Deinococcus sp. Leaf326 TaxID=1736338 RepID=UPI0006FBB377|nr:hypothetical protein [Deinococcus sp. Leaf326]KQR22900.1 hypothetical protein ASF71_06955 [Deinococcus sp. Leaf326]
MRETHEWTDAELATLEAHYCLRGGAFVRARHPNLTPNAIRQMATRLNLADDLREYTPARQLAQEAGTTRTALWQWLARRPWARRHCRMWGHELLLPAPVVALWLPSRRRAHRPRGWVGVKQAASLLGVGLVGIVHRQCAAGELDAVKVRGEWFVDPACLPARLPTAPPPNHISVQALAAVSEISPKAWHAGVPEKVTVKRSTGRPACYAHERQARHFLTARGHRAEQVETLLRRAVALDVARVKI